MSWPLLYYCSSLPPMLWFLVKQRNGEEGECYLQLYLIFWAFCKCLIMLLCAMRTTGFFPMESWLVDYVWAHLLRPIHWHIWDALKKNTLSDQSLLSRRVMVPLNLGSSLLLQYFPWDNNLQVQSTMFICSQNVFILFWVTGGSSSEFLERSAFEPKFNTACLNPGNFCAFYSKLVSKYSTNLCCCLACFPLDLPD